jgi:hypothetical protein
MSIIHSAVRTGDISILTFLLFVRSFELLVKNAVATLSGRSSRCIDVPEDRVARDNGRGDASDEDEGSFSHDENKDMLLSLRDRGPSCVRDTLASVTARGRGDIGRNGPCEDDVVAWVRIALSG